MNLRFSHIDVLVSDLDETASYYRRVLGCRASEKLVWVGDGAHYEYRYMFKDAMRFALMDPRSGQLKDWLERKGPGTIYRLAFTTPDMKKCYDELVAVGVQPEDIDGRPLSADRLVMQTGTRTIWLPKTFGDFSIEILEEAHFEGRMDTLRSAAG